MLRLTASVACCGREGMKPSTCREWLMSCITAQHI